MWLESVISGYSFQKGAISFIFCMDDYLLEINRKYLNHDYYTDVITFDYTEDSVLSGDIFISLDTVQSNSSEYQTTYEEELYRVMVHGILHLMGFKDKTHEEEIQMRSREDRALEWLKTH